MTPGLSPCAIARLLGGEASGRQVLCPGPNHGPKDRSLSIRLSARATDGFILHSHAGDDWQACREYVRDRLGIERKDGRGVKAIELTSTTFSAHREAIAAARREAFIHAQIAAIVAGLVPIIGSPGEQNLREVRRIDVDAVRDVLGRPDAIGWHPAVFFNEPQRPVRPRHPLHGQLLGCIVAIMTDPVTALPTGAISRTYIGPDGKKVGKAKSLGQGGGVVRISPDDEVTQGLFLAEGIESALAGMSIGLRPMWATGSTSIMAKFPVLSGIEALTIVADNDANGDGKRAADEVAARWLEAGREARVIVWDEIGDINDALRAGGDEP
jgi:putative DNA primase/helicase